MAKNYMAAVAKMLGVELGEEFIIQNQDRKETVVIALDGFHVIQPNNVLSPDRGKLLSKVLQGLYEVKKKPWEPKGGEYVYFPNIENCKISRVPYIASTALFTLKLLGMLYKTEVEAVANFPHDYEKLTGRKLEARDGQNSNT